MATDRGQTTGTARRRCPPATAIENGAVRASEPGAPVVCFLRAGPGRGENGGMLRAATAATAIAAQQPYGLSGEMTTASGIARSAPDGQSAGTRKRKP